MWTDPSTPARQPVRRLAHTRPPLPLATHKSSRQLISFASLQSSISKGKLFRVGKYRIPVIRSSPCLGLASLSPHFSLFRSQLQPRPAHRHPPRPTRRSLHLRSTPRRTSHSIRIFPPSSSSATPPRGTGWIWDGAT